MQQKLEKEFEAIGYFYERKRRQYPDKPKDKRLDAEKVGQVLMALFNEMPAQARGQKSLIFSEKYYGDIFNDSVTSEKILLAYDLFSKIDEAKSKAKAKIIAGTDSTSSEDHLILYASYYILYILGKLAQHQRIPLEYENIDKIWKLYDLALKAIGEVAKKEREQLADKGELFEYHLFFKTNRPKKIFDDMIITEEINELIRAYNTEKIQT
jgi:hypothetical protein